MVICTHVGMTLHIGCNNYSHPGLINLQIFDQNFTTVYMCLLLYYVFIIFFTRLGFKSPTLHLHGVVLPCLCWHTAQLCLRSVSMILFPVLNILEAFSIINGG